MKLMFPPYLLFIRGIRGGRVGQSFLVLTDSPCWEKLSIYDAPA